MHEATERIIISKDWITVAFNSSYIADFKQVKV